LHVVTLARFIGVGEEFLKTAKLAIWVMLKAKPGNNEVVD